MDTTWRPTPSADGPLYRMIADQIVAAVADGRIAPGARLPTVRDLAWDLKISPGAVARAYRIATEKGALEATVGRGTFARGPAPRSAALDVLLEPAPAAKIDLRGNRAAGVGQDAEITAAMARLLARGPLPLTDYRRPDDDAPARAALGRWLGCGEDPSRMVMVAGAQEGVMTVLCALRRHGEGVLFCEPIVHPGLKDAAELVHMRLEPVAADEQGVIPEALDAACARRRPDALLLTATLHNPTLTTMGARRRAEIVAVARRRDIAVVEDDVYGGLLTDKPESFATLAPERTYYVNSLSKSVASGLRAGMILTPPGETLRLLRAHQAIAHKTPYLTTALAAELVTSGDADRIRDRVRAEIAARAALAEAALGRFGLRSHPACSFATLPLPAEWTSAEFAVAAAAADVLVAPRAAYAVARAPEPDFIRVALGADVSRAQIADGLARRGPADLMRPETAMIPCQRALFDIPREVAYLNCAYMSPLPLPALAAGEAGLRRKARPWTLTPAHFFDEADAARALFAGLVNADAEGVALVPAASYGLSAAARNLPLRAGATVVTLQDQFPSNVYPWRRSASEAGAQVVAVDLPAQGDATEAVLAAIDDRCAVAALPNVLWTTGQRLDLVAIGARCREVGAALALDLTQSAGAMVTDFAAIRPDFAVAAAYKWLLGPYSVGFLWVAPHRREGRPLEETWLGRRGSEDFARLVAYQDGYAAGARRFDVGERANFALLPAAVAALTLLARWTPAAIEATLGAMTGRLGARAAALGLTPTPDALRGPHYLSLALPDGAPGDLPARLAARGVHVSQRGRSLRVTPHLWCDEADADAFVAALGAAL